METFLYHQYTSTDAGAAAEAKVMKAEIQINRFHLSPAAAATGTLAKAAARAQLMLNVVTCAHVS